jgi:hypothetical protein
LQVDNALSWWVRSESSCCCCCCCCCCSQPWKSRPITA